MTVYAAERVSSSLKWDEDFHRTYTSVYQVLATYQEGPRAVANASGVPAYGSSYSWWSETDLWAFCKSVTVDPAPERIILNDGSQGYKWLLRVIHSSKPSSGSNDNTTERDNPLNDPAVWSGTFRQFNRTVYRDKDGNPIVNVNSMPIEPSIQIPDAYDTIRVSFNTATIDLGDRSDAINKTNNAAFWGLASRRIKLTKWDYQILYAGTSLPYIKHNFEFLISGKLHPTADVCTGPTSAVGWYNSVPNSGNFYYEGGVVDADNQRMFTDSRDEPTGQLGMLACDGDRLADGTSPKWLVFAVEEELDFTTLPVPNTLPAVFV